MTENLLSTSSELMSGDEILPTMQLSHFFVNLSFCSEIIKVSWDINKDSLGILKDNHTRSILYINDI